MRLLSKVSTVILGTALAAAMATGQAGASSVTSAAPAFHAQAAASAKAGAIPQVIDAFWFRTRFNFNNSAAGELDCYIVGGSLQAEYPNDIDGTDCLTDFGRYYLWLHGTDRVYDLYHG
jgi:hypothetical protein